MTMADPDLLKRARCLNRRSERVQDEYFTQQPEFFDPKDIVQVKYELLRRCEVEGKEVASTCQSFGFSRTSYYKVHQAFFKGGLPHLMGKPRGRPNPIKLTETVQGFLIAQKARNKDLTAREAAKMLQERYQVQLTERMIQYVWQHYGMVKKN
ncbi:MAG: helix-turn-helix domain-containing protein [Desulfovermiculus sp.]|nr:helix-turn-helix domain-containing protein [Desulfovermiculus sp.]